MLIAYEGIDGSGKTTSSTALCRALTARGREATVVRWSSFQPNDDEDDNALFSAVEEKRRAGKLGPLAYSVWHCADFAYRLEAFVFPALARGEIVIMDRYKYTGYVRDVIRGVNEEIVRSLYAFAPEPDLVIHLDVDAATACVRKEADGAPFGFYECGLDIFSDLDEKTGFRAFQSLCQRRYRAVLPEGTLTLDGTRAKDALNAEILRVVEAKLG